MHFAKITTNITTTKNTTMKTPKKLQHLTMLEKWFKSDLN